MNEATIEVRDQDAATFGLFIRQARDQFRTDAEMAEQSPAGENVERLERLAAFAGLTAEQAAGGTATDYNGHPSVLTAAADLMLRDLIAQAAELAKFGPPSYDRLAALGESIAWWSGEGERLYAAELDAEGVVA